VSNPVPRPARIGGMAVKAFLALVLGALAFAGGNARAADSTLVADVGLGDSFAISLKDSSGAAVKHLDPGTYTLLVHDHSSIHNFDLNGPGVSVATDVAAVGDKTFTITVSDGTYVYVCDEHPTVMKGSFTVGSVSAPPPPSGGKPAPLKLSASIGPGVSFSLKPSAGAKAQSFKLTVTDRSKTDGFRLAGPGFAKSTGAAFTGTVTWTGTLKAGKWSYGSARSATHRRTLIVSG
jgi:plastocyanin